MNVLLGHVAAGATWPVPWKTFQQENPEMAAQLEVKWQTETLPNNGWVARSDTPEVLTKAVGKALVRLNSTQEGRAMLEKMGITRFECASNKTYRPVLHYLKVFSKTVRHVDY
jgi:phosphonate transport system substrate-binding protein